MNINNDAGETVATGLQSEAEAVRWWKRLGRSGDYLADTDELMRDVAEILNLDD
jgi:hypothetical protein